MIGLPKGLDNIPAQVAEFKDSMDALNAKLDATLTATLAQMIGAHGTQRAAELMELAEELKAGVIV